MVLSTSWQVFFTAISLVLKVARFARKTAPGIAASPSGVDLAKLSEEYSCERPDRAESCRLAGFLWHFAQGNETMDTLRVVAAGVAELAY